MITKVQVEQFPAVSSDIDICDVARVSFSKEAKDYSDTRNKGLLSYLAKNGHWSPFGHARLAFLIQTKKPLMKVMADFFLGANLAGFSWVAWKNNDQMILNGSLWAFYENLKYLPEEMHYTVLEAVANKYPESFKILFSTGMLVDAAQFGKTESYRLIEMPKLITNKSEAKIAYFSFRVKAPIFVARQAVKHQVHLCWNEVSRRYVDAPPQYFEIEEWRARPADGIKQGSGGKVELSEEIKSKLAFLRKLTDSTYSGLLEENVAPELARAVLPHTLLTDWIWTGSLAAWKRVCNQRLDSHAQKEIREMAEQIDPILREHPVWANL